MGVYGTTIITGATPVVNGTSGRILYNNSSAVGEATVTGTLGSVVLSTAPTLTGPVTISEAVGSSGLTITGATQTTSQPALNITQTWNAGAVTFTGLKFNVTDTASAVSSLLIDLQANGASNFKVRRGGGGNRTAVTVTDPAQGSFTFGLTGNANEMNVSGTVSCAANLSWGNGWYTLGGAGGSGVTSTWSTLNGNIALIPGTTNIVEQRNGTNAQTFNLGCTYTSSTSYEYLSLSCQSSVGHIGMTKGSGGGTARVLQIDYGGTTTSALTIPAAITGAVVIAGGSVGATTAITLGGATQTATSGTYIVTQTTGIFNPSSTSTMVAVQSYINPTINYSAGTPGAGSYEALKIAAVETALPTGTNYLIRASAGATGFTDKFLVRNNGAIYTADTTLLHTIAALTDGAAAATATMTNAPAAGNPTKWIPIDDNGTTRYIPAW